MFSNRAVGTWVSQSLDSLSALMDSLDRQPDGRLYDVAFSWTGTRTLARRVKRMLF
jgi:hypothetical protein